MEKKFQKMCLVLKIIVLELAAGTTLYYDRNTCDRPTTC